MYWTWGWVYCQSVAVVFNASSSVFAYCVLWGLQGVLILVQQDFIGSTQHCYADLNCCGK